MATLWGGYRGAEDNTAADEVVSGLDHIRTIFNAVVPYIDSWDVDIPDSDISALIMPTIDWNELDIQAARRFLNDAAAKFLGEDPPDGTVDIPPIPDMTPPDVNYEYDPEPLATVETKIISDVQNNTFGIETADKAPYFAAPSNPLDPDPLRQNRRMLNLHRGLFYSGGELPARQQARDRAVLHDETQCLARRPKRS